MADVVLCTVCLLPLEDGQPIQWDISGAGAHLACVDTPEEEEEDAD